MHIWETRLDTLNSSKPDFSCFKVFSLVKTVLSRSKDKNKYPVCEKNRITLARGDPTWDAQSICHSAGSRQTLNMLHYPLLIIKDQKTWCNSNRDKIDTVKASTGKLTVLTDKEAVHSHSLKILNSHFINKTELMEGEEKRCMKLILATSMISFTKYERCRCRSTDQNK